MYAVKYRSSASWFLHRLEAICIASWPSSESTGKVGTMGTESGKSEAWSPPSGSRTQRSSCARGRFWGLRCEDGETARQIPQYREQDWECLEAFVHHSRVQAQKLSRQWPRWRHNWLNLVSNPPPEEPIGFLTVLNKNIYLPRLLVTMES